MKKLPAKNFCRLIQQKWKEEMRTRRDKTAGNLVGKYLKTCFACVAWKESNREIGKGRTEGNEMLYIWDRKSDFLKRT